MTKLDGLVKVRAVVFDVYGTIATITNKRNPFGKLLQLGELQGRARTPQDRVALMTQALSINEAAELLSIALTDSQRDELDNDFLSRRSRC